MKEIMTTDVALSAYCVALVADREFCTVTNRTLLVACFGVYMECAVSYAYYVF